MGKFVRVLLTTAMVAVTLVVGPAGNSPAFAATNTALQFDGTDDYVAFGNPAELGLATFTVETWFKRTGDGVNGSTGTGGIADFVPLVTHGAGEADGSNLDANWLLGIDDATDVIAADFEDDGGSPNNHPILGTTVITNDVWHHAALTYDGNNLRIYLDGALETEILGVGETPRSDTLQHVALGAMLNSSGTPRPGTPAHFEGAIDEARVWDYARDLTQIQALKDSEVTSDPGDPGGALVARWGLNEGAGASVGDSIAPNSDGTLTNGPIWTSGFKTTDNTAVLLDGSDDYVTFGPAPELNLTEFTIETWFRRDGAGDDTTTSGGSDGFSGSDGIVPLVAKGRGEGEATNINMNYILGIGTGAFANKIGADFEEAAGGNNRVLGTTDIVQGVWYHAAATYDGTDLKVYLNGVLEGTVTPSDPPVATSIQHASLGSAVNSSGAAAGFFDGAIDEARIWNTARSAAQIAADMDAALIGGTGLVARWGLDEGIDVAAYDSVLPNTVGTLTIGPTWTSGFVPASATAPDAPVLVAPADVSTGVGSSPLLEVTASDSDGGSLEVSFYGRPLASGVFELIGTDVGVASGTTASVIWPSIGQDQTFEWYAEVSDGALVTGGDTWTFHTAAGADPVFVGVGDLAECGNNEGAEATAAIVEGLGDGPIFTTGDNVYQNGTATEFANCYDPVWGQFNDRTYPVPGNHDWGAGSASENLDGYFGYFDNVDVGDYYYSYDIGAFWHVVNLDSECDLVPGGCGVASPQHDWLVADLAANADKNVIAVWHKPRFSSGTTNLVAMQPMVDAMYAAGVEFTLVGHDHVYERLAPVDANGNPDATYGMRHFTVGTGGQDHHGIVSPLAASEALNDQTYGVMKFTLHESSYDWQFLPIDGETFTDSGSQPVHAAPPGPGDFGLDLGSSGSYVTFGDPNELDLGEFTIETWFMRTGDGVSGTTGSGGIPAFIPLVTHGGPESDGSNVDANWLLGIDDGADVIAADFEDDGGSPNNHPIVGTTPITNDVWHHAALTYDGMDLRVYLDGVLESELLGVDENPRADTIQAAGLGVMLESDGSPANGARFDGVLDEVRVWNTARSAGELAGDINNELLSGPGLVARWGMSEGLGSSVADSVDTPLASDGSIIGAGSSWVSGAPFDIVVPTNLPPDAPTVIAPADGSLNVSTSPTLQVGVSDPDGGNLDVTFYGREVGTIGDPFTVVALPDTQHYVDDATDHLIFGAQTQWVLDDPLGLDIALVAHLGDVVDNWNNTTEWDRADTHLGTLDGGEVPIVIAPGNHDLELATGNGSFYDVYIPPSRYQGNPWYGGYMGENVFGPDPVDRLYKNNFELFSAGGMDFVSIALEYGMPQNTLDWAEKVLDAYPDRHAILATHSFLNTSGVRPTSMSPSVGTGATSAQHVWDTLIKDHCNVFMVLNGHYPGEASLTSTNDCGEPVHQLVSDYQSRSNGGDGWLRYMTFNPASNDIDVFTYSPTRNGGAGDYETDSNSQFTLPFDMGGAGFELIGTTTVPSGSAASLGWPGRDENTEYEWFAVVDDGTAETQGLTSTFTTGVDPNWTAFVDLRSSIGDTNAANVLEIAEQPQNDAYDSTALSLIDIDSGADVGPTIRLQMEGINTSSDNPATPAAEFTGGRALDVFGDIVDVQGVYSFEDAGDQFEVSFDGLDPTKLYEVVLTINRDQTGTERWTDLTLDNPDGSASEASGGTTTVVSPTQVRFEVRNNTARGDVGRWVGISPGPDGAFGVNAGLFLAGGSDRSYAPSVLMIREFEAPEVTSGLTVLSSPCVVYDSASATAAGLSGTMMGGDVRTVPVTGTLAGQGGASSCVPDGASSAVFRISSINPLTEGNLLMTPAGVAAIGEAGVVNYGAVNGLDNANTVTVPLSAGGAVDIEANTGPGGAVLTTDVRLVVVGYYSPEVDPDLKFFPVNPCAVADSRTNQNASDAFDGPADDGLWPVGSVFPDIDVVESFDVGQGGGNGLAGCGVPAGADAVMVNVVAVNMEGGSGHLSVGTGGVDPVDEATTPFAVLSPKMNNGATTIVNVGPGGTIAVDVDGDVGASTMIRVEILGYYDQDTAGLDFTDVTPCAVFDTRTVQGAAGSFAGERQHGPANTTTYQIAGDAISTDQGGVVDAGGGVGSCEVPDDAQAVLINLEAVNALQEGNFWVSAAGTTTTGGVLNFNNVTPKMNNANAVVVPLSAAGQLDLEINAGNFTAPDTSVAHARGVIFGYFN